MITILLCTTLSAIKLNIICRKFQEYILFNAHTFERIELWCFHFTTALNILCLCPSYPSCPSHPSCPSYPIMPILSNHEQTWGQIQKYLYLKVIKYFFSSICICICILSCLVFQIQFKYFSNTFVIFSFIIFCLTQPSSSCLLYFMAFYCLLIETSIPYGITSLAHRNELVFDG